MSDAVVNGLAGAGGGIIAQILTYPLQTVNTRQQTQRKAKSSVKQVTRTTELLEESKPIQVGGTFPDMYKVIKEEGWEGLYRGLMPSLVGTAASQGVYYYFYQVFRNRAEGVALQRNKKGSGDGTVGMFSSLIVAALAGCLNVLLTNPIWVVVTRMQTYTQAQKENTGCSVGEKGKEATYVNDSKDSVSQIQDCVQISVTKKTIAADSIRPYGTFLAVQDLYNEAGLIGFWKGVAPTLIMVSNPSIQFMLYESMLKQLKLRRASKQGGLKNVTAMEVFVLGAIAKLGATVATYPLLVVKSRLQAKQVVGGDKALHYTGTLDAILKMIRFEGLAGFYKGMSTKIVQSVFAAAVLFMVKEEMVKAARALVVKNKG